MYINWVISLFGLVFFLLSRIATCTHRLQGVIIVGIYMSSNIYYLLYEYLSRKELCRQIGLHIFVKLSRLDVRKPTCLHHSFSIIVINT